MAATWKLVSGPLGNHLARVPAAQLTMSPSALTLCPKTNAHDNRASLPARFSSAAEDSYFSADLDLLGATGSFETGADAAAWTMLGVGSLASSAAEQTIGTNSGLLAPDAAEAIAFYDVTVRAGEELKFLGACMIDSAADANIRIRNRQTGKWLKGSDSSWNDSEEQVLTSVGSWESIAVTFTMESIEACGFDTVTLRVYIHADGGTAYFDGLALFPSLNWASVHGHNIPPFIVPTLQYSDDDTSWSTQETMPLWRDSFYVALDTLETHRYWRIHFDGQPDTGSLMYMGEVFFGQSFTLLHNPQYGGSITRIEHQTRGEATTGDEFLNLHNNQPQRSVLFQFGFRTDEEYEQFRDSVFRRSRGGGNLIAIAPLDLDDRTVILGRIKETSTVVKSSVFPRSGECEILELALPNVPDLVHVYDAPIIIEE